MLGFVNINLWKCYYKTLHQNPQTEGLKEDLAQKRLTRRHGGLVT